MQGFALLGGKALERRLEDENDKRRKLYRSSLLGICSQNTVIYRQLSQRHVQQFVFSIYYVRLTLLG